MSFENFPHAYELFKLSEADERVVAKTRKISYSYKFLKITKENYLEEST